jgi:hypothetical protein
MSDILSETRACDLLTRLFKARGYTIVRNIMFREYGVLFHIDGWDATARVGFEFLTSEDDDHDDLSLKEYQTLTTAQQRGDLSLFIIDEVEPVSAADLLATANEFLDEVADARKARQRPAVAAKMPAVKKRAAPAKKGPAAKKVSGRKKPPVKKKARATKKASTKRKPRPRR